VRFNVTLLPIVVDIRWRALGPARISLRGLMLAVVVMALFFSLCAYAGRLNRAITYHTEQARKAARHPLPDRSLGTQGGDACRELAHEHGERLPRQLPGSRADPLTLLHADRWRLCSCGAWSSPQCVRPAVRHCSQERADSNSVSRLVLEIDKAPLPVSPIGANEKGQIQCLRAIFLFFAELALSGPTLANPKRIARLLCSAGENVRSGLGSFQPSPPVSLASWTNSLIL
jgi:hypothetical protein